MINVRVQTKRDEINGWKTVDVLSSLDVDAMRAFITESFDRIEIAVANGEIDAGRMEIEV